MHGTTTQSPSHGAPRDTQMVWQWVWVKFVCIPTALLVSSVDCMDMHRVFTHFQPNFSPHLYTFYGSGTCGAPKHAIARHSCVHACLWCVAMGRGSRCDHLFSARTLHNGWYVWNNSHLKVIYVKICRSAKSWLITAWRALYGAPWRAWWIQTMFSYSGTRCDLVWFSGYALTGSLCESNIAS